MSHKTWGGRFKKALDPRVMHFNASLPFDKILFKHDILGSQTHAKMLARQGLITQSEADCISNALEEIGQELENKIHEFDERCEDIHMFIEQLLIAKIGEVGKKLHTGRSRNDQVALDLRLYSRDMGMHISKLLNHLLCVLEDLEKYHAQDKMPGYTHLQQAQPIYLGQFLQLIKQCFIEI